MKYIFVKVKRNGQSAKEQASAVFNEIVALYSKPSDLLAAKQDKFQLIEVETTELSLIRYEEDYTILAFEVGSVSTPNPFDLINGANNPVDKDFFVNARLLEPLAPAEQPIKLTPLQTAQIEIIKLSAELRDEMGRCGFIRFFTDFNNTKAAKYAALRQLNNLCDVFKNKTIPDMAALADEAKKLINDPNVIYTSSVLTSRTATLLNNIIAAGDKTSTVKNTI